VNSQWEATIKITIVLQKFLPPVGAVQQ
jgi:hypothetical protein